MSETRTPVAVIIPHYNDLARLSKCLEALAPQICPSDELVVVDNGSTHSPDALAAAFPQMRLVTEPMKGAANARNRGVAETQAEMLLFIDADCVPANDWVAMARITLARCKADIVGGQVGLFDETPAPRSGPEAFETVFAFDNRDYILHKGFSVTANLVTRRDVFEKTGPFRHGLSEDLDWCQRATAAGFRLEYDDRLCVRHPTRQDWSGLTRKWRRLTDEGFRVRTIGPRRRLLWALRALAMPLSVLAHLPRVLRHPQLHGRTERLRAAATLVRLRCLRMIWMLRQAATGR